MQIFAAGVDNPAFKMVMSKGLRLSKSSAQAPAIAEYVMAHALSLLHPIAEQRRVQDGRDWKYVNFREIGSTRWLMVGFRRHRNGDRQAVAPLRRAVDRGPGAAWRPNRSPPMCA